MSVCCLLIGIWFSPALADAEPLSPTELLLEAETAYQMGARQAAATPDEARQAFRQAAERYEQLRLLGRFDAISLRNQGNAYLLSGELPRAILAYRRGLRLNPNDPELRANLAAAREQVVYSVANPLGRPPIDHWPPWLPRPTFRPMLVLIGLLYSLGCASLTRWWMTRRGWLRLMGVSAFVVALVPLGTLALLVWQERQESRYPLVVIARDHVLLRKGNGSHYPPSHDTALNRGVEGRQLFARGDWFQIELLGGEVGWVPRLVVLLDTEP